MYHSKSIEHILIEQQLVTEEEITKVLADSSQKGKTLPQRLISYGYLSEADYLSALSKAIDVPLLNLKEQFRHEPPVLQEGFSHKYLKEYRILPLVEAENMVQLVMANPLDFAVYEEVEANLAGLGLSKALAAENDILDMLDALEGSSSSTMKRISKEIDNDEIEISSFGEDEIEEHIKDMASDAPIIKLVNHLLTKAIETGASDIHIEPFEQSLRVRYRIDGVLLEDENPPKKLHASIVSRIKIMAKLDIAAKRLPQDGRIKIKTMGKDIDLRISTLPTLYGESVVMRILDRSTIVLDMESLGFPEAEQKKFTSVITKPYGMLLVTGPTGSGKTTTLYAALNYINEPEKKLITVEDPVEYELFGVNQIHVKPQIGLTFSSGLRSIVRQDPDVIMVGEIRDPETANIAIQSALTGHMVFSTLHTNDSAGAITRLEDMGVEPYLISSALMASLAQRLVRVLCPHCKEESPEDKVILEEQYNIDCGNFTPLRGAGCEKCNNTGFKGREGIYELLMIDEEVRRLIVRKESSNVIKQYARKKGMQTLRDDGWKKVFSGRTSVPEVMRVTLEEEF